MKKKNKGFMLAELIITSTIIIAAMVGLYTTFNRIYSLYKSKMNYYHIDGIYATKEMINNLLKNNFNKYINESFESSNSKYIIEDNSCNISSDMCKSIQLLYNVKNMIIAEYDVCSIGSKKCTAGEGTRLTLTNETFKEYIEYVVGYYDITESSTDYNYIVLTEIEENGNNYYSNLRIR